MGILKKLINAFKSIRMKDSSSVTGHELDYLLVSAMYAEHQSAYLNSYETGLERSDLLKILQQYWGINNRNEALEKLENLLEKSNDVYLNVVYGALSDAIQYKETLQEHLPKDTKIFEAYLAHYEKLKKAIPELIEEGVFDDISDAQRFKESGWNYGLCSFIGRCCFDLGYITEDELKEYLRKSYLGLSKYCNSWQEYAASYILGRTVWCGETNERLMRIATELLLNSKSPLKNRPFYK